MSPPPGRWWLHRAALPTALLTPSDAARLRVPEHAQSALARQASMALEAGRIVAIEPTLPDAARGEPVVDLDGAWLSSGFVDPHTHLDKGDLLAMGLPLHRRLFDAIDAVRSDYACWTAEELQARAGFALRTAYAHGVRALNTYLDWPVSTPIQLPMKSPVAPSLAASAPPLVSWEVMQGLRDAWRGRIELTLTSLVTIDALADPAVGRDIARRVSAANGVLGVFVYPAAHVRPLIPRVFELAEAFGLALDFHVDEHLAPATANLPAVVAAAKRHDLGRRTVCGHNCVLQALPEAERDALLDAVAEAQLSLVALPATNLHLQDSSQSPPWATPRLRGVLPMHEARARGIPLALGADNHRDPFFPAGDLDPLQTLSLAAMVAQLDDPAWAWVDAVTTRPASILRCAWDGVLQVGAPADLVVHPGRSSSEVMARATSGRRVMRSGQWLAGADSQPPDFRELDVWRARRSEAQVAR